MDLPSTPPFFRALDGVTVSTEPLRKVIAEHVRPGMPVIVVLNSIEPDAHLAPRWPDGALP